MRMEPKRRKFNKLYCQHCEQEVSKSTWYVHHNQFYDEVRKTWRKDPSLTSTPEQDFDFGSSDEIENVDECDIATDPATLSSDEVCILHTNCTVFGGPLETLVLKYITFRNLSFPLT